MLKQKIRPTKSKCDGVQSTVQARDSLLEVSFVAHRISSSVPFCCKSIYTNPLFILFSSHLTSSPFNYSQFMKVHVLLFELQNKI